ncbi:MAG: TMEM165/GDT1 family protein [Gammaproteobacteria bacterium]|nr:TMEM165/GDT1 family protein [Gammaproteobacteria bacterium]
MDWKLLATVFGTVFLAEIADKTQLATVLFASNAEHDRLVVFLGAALALTAASAIAVFAGALLAHWINPRYVSVLAGAAFVALGIWMVVKG